MSRIVQSFVVLSIVLLAICGHVRAQGTSGTLPDPINSHELKTYADRLKLSASQSQAVTMMHDQYKQDFRALRKGEIADFLKEMRSLQGSTVPKRDVVQGFFKRMEQLTAKIATLDNRLFDQMQTVLTDEQMAMMPRVRLARQRARYAGNQMMWMGGSRPVDLSEFTDKLELNAELFAQVDPIFSQYETKLTSAMGKLFEASTSVMLKAVDAMEQAGFTDKSMSDPESAQKMMETMQQIWRDIMAQIQEASSAISDLNQRTYKSVAQLLPAETARKFRDDFYRQAYPEAGFAFINNDYFADAALKLKELTAEQREAIGNGRDELRRTMDRMLEEAVALIEKHRKTFSPFDFNSEAMQEYQKKLADFQTKAAEAQQKLMQLVTSTLGPDLSSKIGKAAADAQAKEGDNPWMAAAMENAQTAEAEMTVQASEDSDGAESVQQVWSGDQYVPSSISHHDLMEYAKTMKLTEDQKAILLQLHSRYVEKYKAVQDNELAALTKATQAMWKVDETTHEQTGMTAAAVAQIERLRKAAIDAVAQADQSFFDEVQLAVIDEKDAPLLERVRQTRQRTCWNNGQEGMWGWYGSAAEAGIDLSKFMRNQKLQDNDLTSIDAELVKYEQAATPAFHARFDASLQFQNAQNQWQAEMAAARGDEDGNSIKLGMRYQELMSEASKALNEANQAIVTLNRQTLERVLSSLPTDTARNVRNAYNRRAYPNVYNDRLGLDQRLTDALKLEDLGPEQRAKISEIAAEYRPAYAQYCEQMVDIAAAVSAPNFGMNNDADQWQKWQERQEALASLKFERNELSLRTIAKIKSVLSDDAIRRIGGLPEPKKSTPYEDWYE